MFEKEAEEYAKSKKIKDDCIRFYDTKKHFKDGAEFGYNKGYHDAEEHYMNVIDSQHKLVEESKEEEKKCQFKRCMKCTDGTYQSGFNDGYNKANEWHYVKDGLPELYKDVLVVFPRGDCDVKRLTNHNEWVGRGSWCSLTDVIAWKELPELKESE